jgi:hypothetical protein
MFSHFSEPDETDIRGVSYRLGQAWMIFYDATLDYWTAEHSSEDGRHVRFIAAHSGDELAAKVSAVKL